MPRKSKGRPQIMAVLGVTAVPAMAPHLGLWWVAVAGCGPTRLPQDFI